MRLSRKLAKRNFIVKDTIKVRDLVQRIPVAECRTIVLLGDLGGFGQSSNEAAGSGARGQASCTKNSATLPAVPDACLIQHFKP